MPKPIYLDYNATTPHAPEVIEAMRPFLETEFGNPSSSHWYGTWPQKAVEDSRRQVAALLGSKPSEILFTSGGTESNNMAIKGIALSHRNIGRHIITSQIEHPAVIQVCRYLETQNFEITYLPVDTDGIVDVTQLAEAIRPDTILVSIMHANNEVGSIQPIEAISEVTRQHGILLHTDAAQSIGKIPVKVDELGVAALSIAGHKLYAPKGIGALYIRDATVVGTLIHGAGQEMGRRAGTENVLEIVGLGKACELIHDDLEYHYHHLKSLRDRLYEGLMNGFADIRLNGHQTERLPNTLSVSFKHLAADQILDAIGREIAASAGAACHSDTVMVSHVLRAMGIPLEWAKGTIRFSTGRMTTLEEIERAIQIIPKSVKQLYRLP